MKKWILNLIWILTILVPIAMKAQSGVYVSQSVDNEGPTGYCDIVTYTVLVRNFDAPSTMTGRIEYDQNVYHN